MTAQVSPETAVADLVRAADSGDLAALCGRHSLSLLVLFGSATAYLDRPGAPVEPASRDVDVAVLPTSADFDALAFLNELYALTRYEGFDLLRLDRAGIVARQRALTRGIALFEAEPSLFAERQIAAAMEYFDTAWLREMRLRELAEQ